MSEMVMHLEFLLLYRIFLVILSFLFFHVKLIIVLSRSVKNCVRILWRIVWWGLHWIYTLLLVGLPFILCWPYLSKSMGDLSIFWYLLQFLSKDLKFFSNRSFTFLVSVTPKYFMLFVATINDDVLSDFPLSFFIIYV